ncbi:MAG TPA: hypothetical protein VHW24_07345 [Bryobacteraceae bacterium]|nr:hypothetical protein [Bryobacteraceae bacterium]
MSCILFDSARPVVESDPARNDIACFVGLARATGASLPASIQTWLQAHGWSNPKLVRALDAPFTDLPLPIESYGAFTSLFDPGGSDESYGADYLAVAVRSFFAQGGRRCYVIRMGDPLSPADDAAAKQRKLHSLLPSTTFAVDDRRTWHGAGHLGGLPDVSFLALPDLPALCASAPTAAAGVVEQLPAGPAQFVECAPASPTLPPIPLFTLPAPRLTPTDYATAWAPALESILTFLSQGGIRNLTVVAAFPLPQDLDSAAASENPSSAVLAQDVHSVISQLLPETPGAGLSTAFLQLAYPWLTTTGSHVLNESLEPPDGALCGILARNTLLRGAYADATKIVPSEISAVSTSLPPQDLAIPSTPFSWDGHSWKPLIARLSLFGFTPAGLRLLSDVTCFPGESYRSARIHRLVSVISRAAQQLGESVVFRSNGPALWAQIENSLTQLLTQLWISNALDGATAQDAFSIRCDSSTMTQNDLDNGRLIAEVTFNAAATIELIRVTLAIETSGAGAQGVAALAGAS